MEKNFFEDLSPLLQEDSAPPMHFPLPVGNCTFHSVVKLKGNVVSCLFPFQITDGPQKFNLYAVYDNGCKYNQILNLICNLFKVVLGDIRSFSIFFNSKLTTVID